MALVELAIKVGNAPGPFGWLDGMVVEVRRPGFWITPAMIQAFIKNGTVPPAVQAMRKGERRRLRHQLDRLLYFNQAGMTAEQAAADSGEALDWAAGELANYTAWAAKIQQYGGWDTVWHYGELLVFGVVRADISGDDMQELLEPNSDPNALPAIAELLLHRRAWRLAYETVAPPNLIAQWADPNVLVMPIRSGPGIPIGPGLFQEISDAP